MSRFNHIAQHARSDAHPTAWCGVLIAAVALAACSSGDGKTLAVPDATIAPITVATQPAADVDGTLSSVPLDGPTLPSEGGDIGLVPAANSFELIAPWFDGDAIDPRATCDGDNLFPSLSWTAAPAGTVELALTLVDESFDGSGLGLHWVIAGINPTDVGVVENEVPLGAIQGINLFGNVGYDGPCPPPGDPAHVYRFTLHALGQQVELADGTPAADLAAFVRDVSIASTDVTATYQR